MNYRATPILFLLLLPVVFLSHGANALAAGTTAHSSAKVDTISGGDIDINTHWPLDVYYVIGDVTVSAGATLTIAPGAVVKFEWGHNMNVQGGLVADNAVFTSWQDDTYGGDNNDDGASTGEPGDWDGIIYNTSSSGGSLTNCLVRYAGCSTIGGIHVRCTAPVDLINVTAEYTGSLGPAFYLSHIGTISGCVARYNEGYGYQMVADLIDTFSHNSNTQSSNGYANIVRVCSNTLTGSATWSGSYDYLCQNDMTISAEATLMIASGSVVKFEPGHYLNVLGGLVADDVVFTSRRDDAYGGDSNGDGASTGEPGDWDGIIYNTSSTGGSLTDCLVRYAGGSSGGIYVRCTAPVDLINVTAEYTGLLGPGFNLSHIGTISGCIARYNEGYGYQVVADLIDAFSHNSNTQSSNGYANIVHVRSNTLTGSATWSGSYDYLCHGDMTISAGATLTIASGSVVKFEPGNYMNVLGGLVADDVVFTSRRDDAYGGDSNGDGASTGEPRDWNGIRYNTSSTGGSLANCHVRYAGDSGNGGIYVNCTAPVDLINVTAESTGSLGPAFTLASPGTLTGCVCRDNLGDGIRITSTDTHISTTDIYNDTGIGLEYTPADTLTAENCYWGHATGPQHPDNPGGLGTVVTGNVDFIPWSTLPNTLVLDSVLHGIVTDLTTGLPVDGAQVTLSPLYTGSSTVTGETGSWSLDVPAGAGYELVVAAEGYDDHTTSDLGFEPGQTYPLDVELTQTVAVEDAPPPRVLVLEQNRPNPFNPSTTIRFGLPAAGHVALKVYDARGHLVTVLVDGVRPAGRHEEVWSGDDDQGRRVPSGVYTYLLETAGAKKVRTMAVVQ